MSDVFAIYRCKVCGELHSRVVAGAVFVDGELTVFNGFDYEFYRKDIFIECSKPVLIRGENPVKTFAATAEYIGMAVAEEETGDDTVHRRKGGQND